MRVWEARETRQKASSGPWLREAALSAQRERSAGRADITEGADRGRGRDKFVVWESCGCRLKARGSRGGGPVE